MIDTDRVARLVDTKKERFFAVADRIWELAETRWQEHESMATQIESIGNEGFRITTGIAGIPTAFVAEAGTEGPVIAILGEYDALAGLSQEDGLAAPQQAGGNSSGMTP